MTKPSLMCQNLLLISCVVAISAVPNPQAPNSLVATAQMCGGERQSPINLDPLTAVEVQYPTLSFAKYDKAFVKPVSLLNGNTIVFQADENLPVQNLPYLSDGGLPGVYNFHQLHFHWYNSDASRSSKHRISGRQFPAEFHFVHYNQKYGNFTTASGFPDGLAVLAIMMEEEVQDNIALRQPQQIENITHSEDAQSYDGGAIPIPLEDLIPDDPTAFFRYHGSLTTPECNEAVIWTVFQKPVVDSERQLASFREVVNDMSRPLVDNYRPVKALNTRVVSYRPSSQPFKNI